MKTDETVVSGEILLSGDSFSVLLKNGTMTLLLKMQGIKSNNQSFSKGRKVCVILSLTDPGAGMHREEAN